MTPRAEEIYRKIMELTPDERAALVESLDGVDEDPAEVDAAWLAEIERRAVSDPAEDVPWQDVRRKAYSHLRKA